MFRHALRLANPSHGAFSHAKRIVKMVLECYTLPVNGDHTNT